MATKIQKNKKQTRPIENTQRRAAQIMFAVFAIILILSMVLSAVTNYERLSCCYNIVCAAQLSVPRFVS